MMTAKRWRTPNGCLYALLSFSIGMTANTAHAQGPHLRLLGSRSLIESDGLRIARPLDAAFTKAGELLVSDAFNDGVLVYDTRGHASRWIGLLPKGRSTAGKLGGIVGVSDTTAFIYDHMNGRLQEYALRDGRLMSEHAYAGRLVSGTLMGDTLWLALLDFGRNLAVAVLASGPPAASPLRADRAPIAASYRQSEQLAAIHDVVYIGVRQQEIVMAYSGTSEVNVTDRAGNAIRSFRLPATVRPSWSVSLWEQLRQSRAPFQTMIDSMPALRLFAPLSTGYWIAAHVGLAPRGSTIGATKLWVSLVAPRHDAVCADSVVELTAREIQPVLAMRGDTLVVIERAIIGAVPQTIRTNYLVTPQGCAWHRSLEAIAR